MKIAGLKQWFERKTPRLLAGGVLACVCVLAFASFNSLSNSNRSESSVIDWSRANHDVISEMKAAVQETQTFQANANLPNNYLWEGFAQSCGPALDDIRVIASLVNLRADVIPVVSSGFYGTHTHLSQEFGAHGFEAAHYPFFYRPDLVHRYQPAAVVFNFYRKQIDEIPNRDAVLAEISNIAARYTVKNRALTLDGEAVYQEDNTGYQLGALSVALQTLELEPYAISCLSTRSDDFRLSLEDWIISFWVRRSIDGNYDLASQMVDELANWGKDALPQ